MGQGCESGTQLCVEAQNSTQVCSPATGDLKNTPNHHFLPNVDFRAPACGPVAKLGKYGPAAPRWEIWGD